MENLFYRKSCERLRRGKSHAILSQQDVCNNYLEFLNFLCAVLVADDFPIRNCGSTYTRHPGLSALICNTIYIISILVKFRYYSIIHHVHRQDMLAFSPQT